MQHFRIYIYIKYVRECARINLLWATTSSALLRFWFRLYVSSGDPSTESLSCSNAIAMGLFTVRIKSYGGFEPDRHGGIMGYSSFCTPGIPTKGAYGNLLEKLINSPSPLFLFSCTPFPKVLALSSLCLNAREFIFSNSIYSTLEGERKEH